MRGLRRKKLSNCMAYVLIAALFLSLVFLKPMTADAALVNWYDGEMETAISVEAGSKFYIGDFVRILSNGASSTASLTGASYRSQDSKVAAVNGRGYLNAKKAGTSDITVVCQGKTLICHLTVEKKKTFVQSEAVKVLKTAAKKLAKGMPKKLTAAKGFALKKKRDEYYLNYGTNCAYALAYDGFLFKNERPAPDTVDASRSEKLAAPEAGRYLTAEALLRQFMMDNDPTSVNSKKTMRIASVTVNKKKEKFVVKISGRLGADQILAAQLAFPKDNGSDVGKNKANIVVPIYDETAGVYYKGQATLKKGGRQFELEPMAAAYGRYQKTELIKGHVYWIGSKLNWANGTKVTVK